MTELISGSFMFVLAQIVLLDIVLGGDNAIVIALAAGKLPGRLQKTAIIIGTAGAIVIRFIMAWAMIWLLQIPYLHMAGAVLLLWIGINLLRKKEHPVRQDGKISSGGLPEAVGTIMMADAIMSLDNVIGIVGVTQGNGLMVLLGMCISVPIIMYGSHFFIRMIERYPVILYIGGAVLGWASGEMLTGDPQLSFLEPYGLGINLLCVALIPGVAWLLNRRAGGGRGEGGREDT